jgi:hypothetical protein
MTDNINSKKEMLVLNLLNNPIIEIIKQLKRLQEEGYTHLIATDCWGGRIIPYSVDDEK